jgi:hypothetical protein
MKSLIKLIARERRNWIIPLCACIFLLVSENVPVSAAKAAGDFPYVHSDLDGFFYARCIPKETAGTSGKTEIYQVKKEKDQLIDSYDVYSKNGVRLGWSPIAGKVAMMLIRPTEDGDLAKQQEIVFFLGGKRLLHYTTADLQKLGAQVRPDMRGGKHAKFRALGSRQVPGTNEYDFVISMDGKEVGFNILTGKQRELSSGTAYGENVQWLQERIREAKAIKSGMSRLELLKICDVEGGLQPIPATRYVLKSCPLIKVDVEFDAKASDPKTKDSEMKIIKVSRLYLDFTIAD